MAPISQNIHASMRAAFTALILVGLFSGGSAVYAEEPACVRVYREAHSDYFKALAALQTERHNSVAAEIAGSGVFAVCALAIKNYAFCGLVGLPVAAVGVAFASEADDRMKMMVDAERIYQIYLDSQATDGEISDDTKKLFESVSVTDEEGGNLLQTVAAKMTTGELCKDNHTLTWEEFNSKL